MSRWEVEEDFTQQLKVQVEWWEGLYKELSGDDARLLVMVPKLFGTATLAFGVVQTLIKIGKNLRVICNRGKIFSGHEEKED